ncbi:MAG: C25 family cysteine peptidase [Bacteroidales bacterium]|nr:C25 family cysteine peptidase [Bacteroidales bacterium]
MRKAFFTLLLTIMSVAVFAQQWTGIMSSNPSTIKTQLISSSENSIKVNVQVPGFYANTVTTPRGEANVISVPKTVSTFDAGEPNLPMIAIPAIIGDAQRYGIRIINAQYADFEINVAPSKGDFPRSINPDDVPYTYGETYNQDAFFPAQQIGLYEPYILRDFRGQNMVIYPFAYNPATQTLRVYYDLTIEMFNEGMGGENQLTRKSNSIKMDSETEALYANQFINYTESAAKYTIIDEEGELLIICHDAFMDAMTPFVNWKKQIGRPTTMVGTSSTGTTDQAIHSYIEAQYNANPNLTYVLLVGDVAQIPGHSFSTPGYGGKSDNWYGQIVGSDYYNDIFVGRFSAESTDHVTNQVNKVIHYERDINASDTWLPFGTGVATTAGNGGHFGEDDWQHIDNIRTDLLGYNYTEVYRDYQSGGGAHSNAATLSQNINDGLSIINYCNHGSETSWGVFGYSNSNVNALTNVNKLPIVWSVACLNGKYDHYQPCFAETWLRANNGSPEQPTGAIGGMFSYISQPWVPPMYGQDEMVDILVESYSNNIKRTLAGTSTNGNMKILDQYGQGGGQGLGTYMAWILYGDPTLTLRNAVPENMNVTHGSSIGTGSTSFTVNASNGNGARATLTRNNEIMGSAIINNGSCHITFNAPGQTGTATLTVFGYNKITYIATIDITQGGAPDPISVTCSASPSIIARGGSATLNAMATGGDGSFTYHWTPATGLNNANIQAPTATPAQTTTYTCTVTSGGETATGTATITVVCPPTNLTATVISNSNVNLNWTAANPAQSYKIYRNNTMIAQNITANTYTDQNLSAGTYNYQVATVYNGIESPKSNTATAIINAPLQATASARPATIAEGESSTLIAYPQGGTGTYTYSWSPAASLNNANIQDPTATPTQTTTYTVTITSGSETVTATATVTVVKAPTNVHITFGEHPTINWAAIQPFTSFNVYRGEELIASNITGMSYTDTDVVPCPEEEYCYSVATVYNQAIAQSEEACDAMELFLFPVRNAAGEYVWNMENDFGANLTWNMPEEAVNCWEMTGFNIYREVEINKSFELIANVPAIEGQNDYQYFDSIPAGYVSYIIKAVYERDDEMLESDGNVIEIYITGIQEKNDNVSVFPNPTNDILNIKAENIENISVFNLFGQEIMNVNVDNDNCIINMSQFTKGIYMLKVETAHGTSLRRVVVE